MNKLHEINTIQLPASYGNVLIEQQTNDYYVDVLNIGKILVPAIMFYAKEEKFKHFSYLKHFHKFSIEELYKVETTPNPKFLINPNFLMLILKDHHNSLYEYLRSKVYYDICAIHTPYIDNKRNVYLPLDFYKELLGDSISFLDKSQAESLNIKNDDYYKLKDFLDYLFFLYSKDNVDLTTCEIVYKFWYFIKIQQIGSKNQLSKIYSIEYDPEDHYQLASLGIFVKTHSNIFTGSVANPPTTSIKRKTLKNEKHYQNKLKSKIGGALEVKTPVGYIDLLTETQLIEIKFPHGWKSGIGQILAYSEYYPKHEKVLAIIGKKTSINDEVYTLCEKHNIALMFIN